MLDILPSQCPIRLYETFFLEGSGPGLLLYKDPFVVYGLYMFVKGNKNGRNIWDLFLTNFRGRQL